MLDAFLCWCAEAGDMLFRDITKVHAWERVIDVGSAQHDSTESPDPLQGVLKLTLVRVFIQPISLSGMPISLPFNITGKW